MARTHAFLILGLSVAVYGCSDDPVPRVAALELLTTTLPDAAEGQTYSASLSAEGGTERSYRWSVTDGGLPPGLVLAASGTPQSTLSGTPRVSGRFAFSIRVEDSAGTQVARAFTLEISAAPPKLAIDTPSVPGGATGVEYSATIDASGGSNEGYRWALMSGALPPGLVLAADGTPATTLSGTPTTPGTFEFSVQVTDSAGARVNQAFSIAVMDTSLPLEMVTTSLPNGEVDLPYSVAIVGANGSGQGYAWRILSSDLPEGFRLEERGTPSAILSGTPTRAGSFTLRVQLTDSKGDFVRRTFYLDVLPAPPPVRITTFEVKGAEVGRPYNAILTGIGGSGTDYTWTVSAGALPDGLMLAPEGTPSTTLSGTPQVDGRFAFTIVLTDARGDTDDFDYVIVVTPRIVPITITSTALPNGRLGEPYSASIAARDGFGSYNWVVTAGRLPAGLELELAGTPSGLIRGIAGEYGTFTATVTVYDSNNDTDSRTFSFEIIDTSLPLLITLPAGPMLPPASTCTPYTVSFTAEEGSNTGYNWEIISGTLPDGFILDTDGTPSTRLHGLPTAAAAGIYNFTVQITDSADHVVSRPFTLEVIENVGGQRWAAVIGDVLTNDDTEVTIYDVCREAPGLAIPLNPSLPGLGDASTTQNDTRFSPSGRHLAFMGDFMSDGVIELWVADLVSPTARNAVRASGAMATNGDVNDFKWSPDGNWLAYHADQTIDNVYELWVVDMSGAVPGVPIAINAPLSSNNDVEFEDYLFSPDSSKIAWIQDSGTTTDLFNLYVSDLSSGMPTVAQQVNANLPSTSADVDDFIIWTPDSTRLIYNADQAVYLQDELWMVDVSGPVPGAPVQLNGPVGSGDVRINTNGETYVAFDYMISPDGTKLFYIANALNTLNDELFYVDLTGATPAAPVVSSGAIATNGDVFSAAWSPDSTHIAYVADQDVDNETEIYVVDVSGVAPLPPVKINPQLITNGDVNTSQITGFGWSPDSTKVAFILDARLDNVNDLVVTDVRQSPVAPVIINPLLGSTSDVDNFVWAPTSGRIAYRADPAVASQTELFAATLGDGTWGPAAQVNGPMIINGDVSSTIGAISFSVDATRIFYPSDEIVDNDLELFLVDLTTTPFDAPVRVTPALPSLGDVSGAFLQP